ncbi:MAG: Helix-turn-helix of insertion element transposase [Pseudomonadota bacterium]|jgi:transposase-like protein
MKDLNARQLQAAVLLSSGATITATAEQAGITRVTLHNWLRHDDAFIAYLNSLKGELIDAGRAGLQASVALAIETINLLMTSSDNDIVKLNAAKEVLNRAGIINALVIGSDDADLLKRERAFNDSMTFY